MTVLQTNQPSAAEIAHAVRSFEALTSSQKLRYIYALSGLQSVIEDLAIHHDLCAITDCPACRDLRQARATFLALDLVRPNGTYPIFGGTQ